MTTATAPTATAPTATATTATPTTAPSTTTSSSSLTDASLAHPTWAHTMAQISKRSFCLLATSSPAGRPHSAGVLYDEVDGDLFVSTERGSRKGRNIAANRHVAITVPIRRIPFGPPANVMFQSTATLLANDDPLVSRLAAEGRLGTITSHGELDLADGAVVRIEAPQVIHTYGLGISLLTLMREPLRGGGRVERP